VRDLPNLEDGDNLIFSVKDDGEKIVQRQQVIPPDQAWFWTEHWQRLEHEAQEDFDASSIHRYANVDEAIGALQELDQLHLQYGQFDLNYET